MPWFYGEQEEGEREERKGRRRVVAGEEDTRKEKAGRWLPNCS
jgi:hypothetical protein